MTDIICSWLNNDLSLSTFIDKLNFSTAFSNGYLIGEILNKYDLINDCGNLSKKNTAEAKLNNFILLEPILKLLGVSFTKDIAKSLIDGKSSVLINFLYQLYIALENKKRSNLTTLSMQTMQAPATTKLQELESKLYQNQLKKANPRQSDLELHEIIKKYQDYQQKLYERSEHEKLMSSDGRMERVANHRQDCLDRSKALRDDQMEMMNKIEAAVVRIPKPPANRTLKSMKKKNALIQQKEAEAALQQLDDFEKKQLNIMGKETSDETLVISREETLSLSEEDEVDFKLPSYISKAKETYSLESLNQLRNVKHDNNDEYIGKIRERLESDKEARIAREKRRRKVLVNCLKSQYEQEENDRENMIALRLMRQSQMERRIAVQLLQLRHEKDVIKNNRMERERQYQERREQEFINALEKEKELLKQLKQTNRDNLKAEQDLYNMKKAEIKMAKYKKHYLMVEKVIEDIIDLSWKTMEYNNMTEGKIPAKIMRDWKVTFIHGVPQYDDIQVDEENIVEETKKNSLDIQDLSMPISRISDQSKNLEEYGKKAEILDEHDFVDYKQFTNDWEIKDDDIKSFDQNNNILSWVVDHLFTLSNPVDENVKISILPPFPIKVAVVGKCFSGKSTLIQNLVKNNRCISVVPQNVIYEALEAFNKNEEIEIKVVQQIMEKEIEEGEIKEEDTSMKNKTDEERTENQISEGNLNTMINDVTGSVNAEDDTERMIEGNYLENVEDAFIIRKESSPRAIIGKSINEQLLSGKSINDQLLVDAMIEYLGRIPEGTGWIIDDFPATYEQGKLFEKAVTGYDERLNKATIKKRQKTPIQAKECGLDALILLDTPDSACLARAMTISERKIIDESNMNSISKDVIANLQTSMTNFAQHWPKLSKFYSKINENIIKNVNSSEGVSPTDIYLQVEIIMDDIILSKQPPEEILPVQLQSVEVFLIETEIPIETPISVVDIEAASKETLKSSRKRSKGSKSSKASSRGSSAESKTSDKKSSSRKSRSKSKSESIKTNKTKISSKNEKSVKSKQGDVDKGKGNKGSKRSKSSSKGSKSSSKGSRSSSSKGKKSKMIIEEPKVEEIVPEVQEPQPGEAGWIYAEKPIDKDLTISLYNFWESLNNVYMKNCKSAFREIRQDKEEIIRYLYAVKKAFRQFLVRPDAKQEYIDQFHKDYNDISEEWREDDEVQQELHIRITELRDQLLEISQENQVSAETEIEKVKSYGWSDDKIGMVSNQYLNLMQSEFDHFQDVVRLLRDYYRSMINPIMEEFKPEFIRLPLIEIPTEKENQNDTSELEQNADSSKQINVMPSTSPGGKKAPVKGGKAQAVEVNNGEDTKELSDEDIEAMFKTRIPLIEFKSLNPQITSAALTSVPIPTKVIKGKELGAAIVKLIQSGKFDKKGEKIPESISIPVDLDEKLLYDAVNCCYTMINGMLDLEISPFGEKEDVVKPGDKGDKGKIDKKGKGGKKSRTPTPKKTAKDKSATATVKDRSRSGSAKKQGKPKNSKGKKEASNIPVNEVEENEEDKLKRILMERAKNEYIVALQKEASITRMKLLQIMERGTITLKDLKDKIELMFRELSALIADKLLKEDTSIKKIEDVFRYHVEMKLPLKEKIELMENIFFLDEIEDDLDKVGAYSRPSPIEPLYESFFSIKQLNSFNSLFQASADTKNSFISIFDFIKLVGEALLSVDSAHLPPYISNCSHIDASVANIAEAFSCDKEYVNWRLFMLSCSDPWEWPTQADLLDILGQFKKLDQQNTGFITREQYNFVEFWFNIPSTPSTPSDIMEPKTVNRMSEIKNLFFNIFKYQNEGRVIEEAQIHVVEYLDYEDMLLHFAAFCTDNYYTGLLRSLSVVLGRHVPHIPIIMKDIQLTSDQVHENVPQNIEDVEVTIRQLYKVLSFGHRKSEHFTEDNDEVDLEDTESERDSTLIESLKTIYENIEQGTGSTVTFTNLLKHESVLECFVSCQWFRYIDTKMFFIDSSESSRTPVE